MNTSAPGRKLLAILPLAFMLAVGVASSGFAAGSCPSSKNGKCPAKIQKHDSRNQFTAEHREKMVTNWIDQIQCGITTWQRFWPDERLRTASKLVQMTSSRQSGARFIQVCQNDDYKCFSRSATERSGVSQPRGPSTAEDNTKFGDYPFRRYCAV